MFHRELSSQKTEKIAGRWPRSSEGKPVVKIEPSRLCNREISAFGIPIGTAGAETPKMESLILAQDERWRRA
jgi:hypothetical protein